ncbi:MAG: DUF1553 domain-containing protein, partial [Planctomycetales bacterium]|nr:DUF1553 domain-containing protein [Planctomycetales bacterium]
RSFFGYGLVRTSGDFGTQSRPPTDPELLDWLAVEWMEKGWSPKQLHRMIVTSATYQQSAAVTPALLKRDPQNELLARGPRVRVEAETVRDIALAAAGLLSPKVGGPSVYPPQPDSVTALAYGGMKWPTSQGENRWRRSLYTFSKRTAPFAAYAAFDAPSGENCTARRDRSNTPLQALTMLNDEMFLEAARALGRKAATLADSDDAAKATYIFRRLLTRPPADDELAALLDYFQRQRQRLADGALSAADVAADKSATADAAAWTMVARAVMNLDETITKP